MAVPSMRSSAVVHALSTEALNKLLGGLFLVFFGIFWIGFVNAVCYLLECLL